MKDKEKPTISLFSDGGADPNPGIGGFGVILKFGNYEKEFSKGFERTTNNRMELQGIIYGLEQLNVPAIVTVYSDSKYVINAINNGWVEKWRSNNWYRNNKEQAINIDLWKRMLALMELHEVSFHWIKGHDGHTENERCDALATKAIHGKELLVDEGYITYLNTPQPTNAIEKEGDACRKCNTPVIKRRSKGKKRKAKQNYYYTYYLLCPNCQTMYLVESAKVAIENNNTTLFD